MRRVSSHPGLQVDPAAGWIRLFFWSIFLIPLLFAITQRSLTAYDEGYYALQARWILQNHQWLVPQAFGHFVFDRSIGLQWMIAISFKLFGVSVFAARLPVLLAAGLTLLLTYKIATRLADDLKLPPALFATFSAVILASTPLWLNYTHYAGQDIPLLAAELLCVFAILKTDESSHWVWSWLIGIALSLAFFIKGFMVAVPMFALAPYVLLYRRRLLFSWRVWGGLLLGVALIALWLGRAVQLYGWETVSPLWSKLLWLSHGAKSGPAKTVFGGHGAGFYFWNIPANAFPWPLVAIFGWVAALRKTVQPRGRYFLCFYPLLVLTFLLIFKTKTPYYPIQMLPFIAMAAALFLSRLAMDENAGRGFFVSLKVTAVVLVAAALLFILGSLTHRVNLSGGSDTHSYLVLLLLLTLPWLFISQQKSNLRSVVLFMVGPWLALCGLVQMGMLDDRTPAVRQLAQQTAVSSVVRHHPVEFVISPEHSTVADKQLIVLAFYSYVVGARVARVADLAHGSYAWVQGKKHRRGLSHSDTRIYQGRKPMNDWTLIYHS